MYLPSAEYLTELAGASVIARSKSQPGERIQPFLLIFDTRSLARTETRLFPSGEISNIGPPFTPSSSILSCLPRSTSQSRIVLSQLEERTSSFPANLTQVMGSRCPSK